MFYKLSLKWTVELKSGSDSEQTPFIQLKIKQLNKEGHIKYKVMTVTESGTVSGTSPTKYEDFTSRELPVESIDNDDEDDDSTDITHNISNLTDGENTIVPGNKYKLFFIFRDLDKKDSGIQKSKELIL